MTQKLKKVFILGGGFAGIRTAHLLSRAKAKLMVALIDRQSFHVNTPVLYEISNAFVPWEREAVGRVLKEAAGASYAKILDGTDVVFTQGTVSGIEPHANKFFLTDGREETADYLVLALGSQAQTNAVPGVNNNAFTLRNVDQAIALRSHIISLFLRFRNASPAVQQKAFSFVIVGGGAAGVEYAAELAYFLTKLCALHRVGRQTPKIIICEEGGQILRDCSSVVRQRAQNRLRELGVQLSTQTKIINVRSDGLETDSGAVIFSYTTIWLAGVRANDVLLRSGFPINSIGGLLTDEHLEVRGNKDVFACGDCTYFVDSVTGMTASDVAWAALRQAETVAANILRRVDNKGLISYYPQKRPLLLSVGGKFGIASIGSYQFSGFFAWLFKQFAGLWYLWSILPNTLAFRFWLKSLKVKVSND